MKLIQRLQDFKSIEDNYESEYIKFLRREFHELYDYFSNGKPIDRFHLTDTQSMVILENKVEFSKVKKMGLDIEFIDKENVQNLTILRIGLRQDQEIQLYYYLKGQKKAF